MLIYKHLTSQIIYIKSIKKKLKNSNNLKTEIIVITII